MGGRVHTWADNTALIFACSTITRPSQQRVDGLSWRSERSDVLFHVFPSGVAWVSVDLFKNLS